MQKSYAKMEPTRNGCMLLQPPNNWWWDKSEISMISPSKLTKSWLLTIQLLLVSSPLEKKKKETRQVSSDINKCPWWPKFQVKIRDSKPQKKHHRDGNEQWSKPPAANLIYMSVINSSPTNLIKAKRRFQRRFYRNVWNKIHQHQPNIQHALVLSPNIDT